MLHNLIVVNCQVAWYIYGNTFHYSLNNKKCKLQYDDMKSLWILMQVILSFGYVVFLSYTVVCFTFTVMMYLWVSSGGIYSRRRQQEEEENRPRQIVSLNDLYFRPRQQAERE